jgi:hypothetical protein
MVRDEVQKLLRMGPFPSSDDVVRSKQANVVDRYGQLLKAIEKPVTDEEAGALTRMFGPDDFFGLCWTLVHLIETAPNWTMEESLADAGNEWIQMLKDREARWREAGYPTRSFYKEAGLPDPKVGQSVVKDEDTKENKS